MKCPSCGTEVEGRWRYCPKCGARIRRRSIFDLFSRDLFSRMDRQISQMEREMKETERSFEALDISPLFRQPARGRGFTIKIERHGGGKPRVSVQTFGNVNKQEIEEQVRKQLKTEKPIKISLVPRPPKREAPKPPVPAPKLLPKETREPKTEVKRIDSKVTVEMELPGVRDEKDIQINELQESVEVRAIADNKAYFKILTKPAKFGLSEKSFKKGRLHLEFS